MVAHCRRTLVPTSIYNVHRRTFIPFIPSQPLENEADQPKDRDGQRGQGRQCLHADPENLRLAQKSVHTGILLRSLMKCDSRRRQAAARLAITDDVHFRSHAKCFEYHRSRAGRRKGAQRSLICRQHRTNQHRVHPPSCTSASRRGHEVGICSRS